MEAERVVRPKSGYVPMELEALANAIVAVPVLAGGLGWVLAVVAVMSWLPVKAGHGEAPTWT